MKIQKTLIVISTVYVIMRITLLILGITGDTSEENIKFALNHFSASEIDSGKSYFLHTSLPSAAEMILEFLFLLTVSIKGYHSLYAGWLSKKIKSRLCVAFISFISLFICLNIIEFPFAYFASFHVGKQFGLMNADLQTWMIRYISSSAIFILIACFSLSVISFIIKKTRRYHIYIPIAVFIISICVTELYPKIIIPLFYKMESLPDSELKNKIKLMCVKADIDIEGIYTIDSSRISNTVNARVMGFGSKRKILINDTLINMKNDDEILAIIGHEMCHYAEEHFLKGMSLAVLSLYLFIPLLSRLSKISGSGDLKFLTLPQMHSILLLLIIFLMFLSNPAKNAVSRYFEKRADAFSINLTGKPEAFISIKKKTAVKNKSYILPDKIYTWFYSTHPSVLERIRYAETRLKAVKQVSGH